MSIPENKAKISVQVYPSAARNEIAGLINGVLRIKLSAPPVKGKANRELIAFLGQLLDISKDSINIVKGHTTRNKIVTIDGLSQKSVFELIFPEQGA